MKARRVSEKKKTKGEKKDCQKGGVETLGGSSKRAMGRRIK